MNMYDAIYRRKSVRHFKWEPIPQQKLKQIERYRKEVQEMDETIKYHIEIVDNLKEQNVIKGTFKVKSPYYLVFYSELKEGHLLNAGFIMQQMVLYMSVKGIGSCYQGGAKLLPTVNQDGYKEIMVLAFGIPDETVYRFPDKAKRYKLKEICIFKEEVGDHIRTLLNAARMAPSAMNIQPWRFVVYSNRIHLFVRKRFSIIGNGYHDFDIGIVLAHLMITLEELWLEGAVTKKEEILDRQYRQSQYIASLVLK